VLIVVELSPQDFADRRAMTGLAAMAGTHELVLISSYGATAAGAVPALRRALPGRQVVALVVDGDVAPHERDLVLEVLEEGRLPLILTVGRPYARSLDWLDPDSVLTATEEWAAAGTAADPGGTGR
jgi:hypothetical protein